MPHASKPGPKRFPERRLRDDTRAERTGLLRFDRPRVGVGDDEEIELLRDRDAILECRLGRELLLELPRDAFTTVLARDLTGEAALLSPPTHRIGQPQREPSAAAPA